MKQLEIEVDVDPSRRPIEAVEHGDLDVALTTVPPTDAHFTLTPLFDDEIVALAKHGGADPWRKETRHSRTCWRPSSRVHRKSHPDGPTPPIPRDLLRAGESEFLTMPASRPGPPPRACSLTGARPVRYMCAWAFSSLEAEAP